MKNLITSEDYTQCLFVKFHASTQCTTALIVNCNPFKQASFLETLLWDYLIVDKNTAPPPAVHFDFAAPRPCVLTPNITNMQASNILYQL